MFKPTRIWGLILGLAMVASTGQAHADQADASALWNALKSGNHFVMIRHALAPGFSDPPGFDVNDCATQRNLSDEGRAQAARIGERFKAHGIDQAKVVSSQWCRCLDTATGLGLGPVKELPALNSFFENFHRREPQTRELTKWLDEQRLDGPLALVTHQVNISAFTGRSTRSGEMVVLSREGAGNYKVVGALRTD